MKIITIAFDLDSVLADPMPVFARVIKTRFNAKIIGHDRWRIDTKPTLTSDQFFSAWNETYFRYDEIPILDGAVSLLNRLSSLAPDDPIKIVTHRHYDVAEPTFKLVHRIYHGLLNLVICPKIDKSLFVRGYTHFVEDRARNVFSLAQNGIKVYMPNCDWNQNYNHPELANNPNINRIKGVYELLPAAPTFIKEV